jgi:hypothetical protein
MFSLLKTITLSLVVTLVCATKTGQPVMGYYADTNYINGQAACWLQEGYIKVQSDYLKHTNMTGFGYDYLIMGDCW